MLITFEIVVGLIIISVFFTGGQIKTIYKVSRRGNCEVCHFGGRRAGKVGQEWAVTVFGKLLIT